MMFFLIVDALKGRREDEEDDGDNRLTERKGALFLMLLRSENKINRLKFIYTTSITREYSLTMHQCRLQIADQNGGYNAVTAGTVTKKWILMASLRAFCASDDSPMSFRCSRTSEPQTTSILTTQLVLIMAP
jgi:hypothetical protein